jgi:hypothetical protein
MCTPINIHDNNTELYVYCICPRCLPTTKSPYCAAAKRPHCRETQRPHRTSTVPCDAGALLCIVIIDCVIDTIQYVIWTRTRGKRVRSSRNDACSRTTYRVRVLTLAFDIGDDGEPRGPRGEGCIFLPQHKSNNNIIF